MRALFLALLAASAALAGMSTVYAQGIEITGLICVGDPEVVVIYNNGSAPQDMTGWELRSDPEASEVFDLSGVTIPAGQGISVFSGPSAPPTNPPLYRWTLEYRYRDFDPADYARVVNNLGSEVDRENCPGVEPTVTPAPPSVGGIAELPEVSGPSSPSYIPLAGLAGVAVALLTAGAWHALGRWRT